jgi:N-acetylglucosaminyldiphosphoundecaprenol N-acetyl-beta-D-mannosaminyltransferase
MKNERIPLFGILIDAVRMHDAVCRIDSWCRQSFAGPCRLVVTPNVDHAVMVQSDAGLRQAYERASMVLADGAPVVLASRILGKALPERVAGSDLVPALFDHASASLVDASAGNKTPLRIFLLGAAPGVADRAKMKIENRWAGVEVVGTLSPPIGFEKDERANREILAAVAEFTPDLLIVGLGAPKQELWTCRHADRLQAKVALCAGATIDFLAGEKSRSPQWMRRVGLEWLHRLAREPTRLGRRYGRDAWIFPQLVWSDWKGA